MNRASAGFIRFFWNCLTPVSTSPFALTHAGNFVFADQSLVLNYSGLGLLSLAVAMAVVSLWLGSSANSTLANKWPRVARLIHSKPLMLATLVVGVTLLVLNRAPQQQTLPQPQYAPQPPAATAEVEPPSRPVPASPAPDPTPSQPIPISPPAPQVTEVPPPVAPPTVAVRPPPATPVRPPKPSKPAPSVTIEASSVRAVPATKAPAEAAPKAPRANSRCTLLLEKAGSGEPLSDAEQKEMGNTCR